MIKPLIDFVTIDIRLDQLSSELEQVMHSLATLDLDDQKLDQGLVTCEENYASCKKDVHMIESELVVLEHMKMRAQKKMGGVSTVKESDSLEAELALIEQKKADLEEKGLELLMRSEQVYAHVQECRASLPERHALVQQARDVLQERKQQITRLQYVFLEKYEEAKHLVNEDELNHYMNMKARIARPIVPIIDGHCSECYYVLSNQRYSQAKQDELVTCQGCYRLLYVEKGTE